MYQYSRAIFRRVEPLIATPVGTAANTNSTAVLRACESTVARMATDRGSFANPTKTLFNDIRSYFPLSAQPRVHAVVATYLGAVERFIAEHPREAYAAMNGSDPHCQATTRKGAQCQRSPLATNGYCPSHQHLVEPDGHGIALAG